MPAYLGVGRLQRYAVGWHGGDHSQPLVIAIPTDTVGRLAQAPKRLPYAAVTSTDRPTHLPPRPRRTARPCLAALRTAKQGVFHDPNDHQFLGPRPHSQKTALPDSRSHYCWDITYLPTGVRGLYFYLYLFVDIFSRKVVGWQVFDCESAEKAAALLEDICRRQGISANQITVHSDNGGPMKGETMLAAMQRLGVAHSRSRPAVSNDNPYAESLFKTLKYRPQLPLKPFADLLQARRWVTELVHWYNDEHRHSAIRFVTPAQRHAQTDKAMLHARAAVYEKARHQHPTRWSGNTRNWSFINQVHLNPDKPQTKESEADQKAA